MSQEPQPLTLASEFPTDDPLLPPDATFRPEDHTDPEVERDDDELPPALERLLARDDTQAPDTTPPEHDHTERATAQERVRTMPDPGNYLPDLQPPTYTEPPPSTEAEITAHILDRARSLDRDGRDYINLANLRSMLHPGLDRSTVDAVLRRMSNRREANFTADDYAFTKPQAVRDAALRMGNQDNHWINLG
ncbi:hypothetical protein [Actinophytocola gossypii]|uniref:EF-hand domain-containing protein n=1 Tax=Actinophytocola gossypii TaxID=2812003 RepID=A0ABT2JIT3_9PSEU|nr:hypothetical protein [Actinophytocola gossypii]MCT2587788.1 hypothetical protein [Actinophytocola gossypii]